LDRELLLERLEPYLKHGRRYWPLALGASLIVVVVVSLGMCLSGGRHEAPIHRDSTPSRLTLRCPMFRDGNAIPALYTANGRNVSPPLEFFAIPPGTRELALIMEDTSDATVVNWVVYRIPPDLTGLAEGLGQESAPALLKGGVQGKNSHGTIGYHGPDASIGGTRYRFTLYALHTPLDAKLEAGMTAEDLLPLLKSKTEETTTLTGSFRR
jgi:Raf kinase inhibitor-like YbhB/YbcL family protein